MPQTDQGIIFGSNPECNVCLDLKGISNFHFSLTFDDDNYPIIRDLSSLMGTEVTYNGQGKGVRRDFQWIVGGHLIPQLMNKKIITAASTYSILIVVAVHNITSPEYIDKVNIFKRGTATTKFGTLHTRTCPATGHHTPPTGDIYVRKKLGEGSFGVVTHLWNVSTGIERVVKAPTAKALQKGIFKSEEWRHEARIMGKISHPHIVHLIEATFTHQPKLYLEYMPCGSLEDQADITYSETVTIVRQCLSALSYLHGRYEPITHRDIKPANILVQSRSNGNIYVKLGDFGLARDSFELMTLCGTPKYIAPEVYSEWQGLIGHEEKLGYTPAVDVWSLGVVACELSCGLPKYQDQYLNNGTIWCKTIESRLRDSLRLCPNNLGQFLLETMVVLSPESRFSAGDCYDMLLKLPDDGEGLSLAGSLATTTSTQRYNPSEAQLSSTFTPYVDQQGGDEMTHYLQGQAANPFNRLHVGSSLELQLFNHGAASSETGGGSGPSRLSFPSREIEGETPGNGIGVDEPEEMAKATFILHTISRDSMAQ
ncbi:protein kinase [Hypoxylon sp. NC1633]|nr:protein kinase [Hypoxylon sp. NC1633]